MIGLNQIGGGGGGKISPTCDLDAEKKRGDQWVTKAMLPTRTAERVDLCHHVIISLHAVCFVAIIISIRHTVSRIRDFTRCGRKTDVLPFID